MIAATLLELTALAYGIAAAATAGAVAVFAWSARHVLDGRRLTKIEGKRFKAEFDRETGP